MNQLATSAVSPSVLKDVSARIEVRPSGRTELIAAATRKVEGRLTPSEKRARDARYARKYRAKQRASLIAESAPSGTTSYVAKPAAARDDEGILCRLCHEVFDTGSAYMAHFKARVFESSELHRCMSREEIRESGVLATNWERGSWRLRNQGYGTAKSSALEGVRSDGSVGDRGPSDFEDNRTF